MKYISLSQTVNPSYQLIINQSAVFHYLREHGPTYRNEISNNLQISLPSVARALNALEERGFVELVDYRKNDQSRTVPFYQVTISDGFMISIDLLKGVIAAQNLQGIFSISYFELNEHISIAEELIQIIENFVHDTLRFRLDRIKSICIGSPGIVDVDAGVVRKAIFHPGIVGIPLKSILQEQFSCIVFIDNVVNIAAYANYCEYHKHIRNIVSCDIGLEIGAGLLIDGKVYRGEHFMAGETGFFVSDTSKPDQIYKRTHTFRSVCSEMAKVYENKDIEAYQLDEKYCLNKVSELFSKAFAGDAQAEEIIDGYVEKIALMLNKIEIVLNPNLIVISGDICQIPNSDNLFLKKLNKKYAPLSNMDNEIVYSTYGPLVTVYGGGEMALENYIASEFPYVMRDTI